MWPLENTELHRWLIFLLGRTAIRHTLLRLPLKCDVLINTEQNERQTLGNSESDLLANRKPTKRWKEGKGNKKN